MKYSTSTFLAFKTSIEPSDNNQKLIELFADIGPPLELQYGQVYIDQGLDKNWQPQFRKYAVIRSIEEYGCTNPIIVWKFYDQDGSIGYRISPGKTRWRLWEATQSWSLPVLILDTTCNVNNDLSKYFHRIEPYNESITLKSETPTSHPRARHKLQYIDPVTGNDQFDIEEKMMFGGVHDRFWPEYQHLENILPQLKIFKDDQEILMWGKADKGSVEIDVNSEIEVAKIWLNHLQINC